MGDSGFESKLPISMLYFWQGDVYYYVIPLFFCFGTVWDATVYAVATAQLFPAAWAGSMGSNQSICHRCLCTCFSYQDKTHIPYWNEILKPS